MTQVNINGELFDVFIVRGQDADPVPILMDVAPRTLVATVSVASTTDSTAIVAANANRKGISIYNNSTAALFLSYANPATAATAAPCYSCESLEGEDTVIPFVPLRLANNFCGKLHQIAHA